MNKCQFCQKETDNTWRFLPMTLPIPRLEDSMDKLGRDEWFKLLEKDPSTLKPEVAKLLDELNIYDQMLNTVGRGYCCDECDILEEELYNKYYPPKK